MQKNENIYRCNKFYVLDCVIKKKGWHHYLSFVPLITRVTCNSPLNIKIKAWASKSFFHFLLQKDRLVKLVLNVFLW